MQKKLKHGKTRIMTMQGLELYAGQPVYYLTYHEVLKDDQERHIEFYSVVQKDQQGIYQ